MEIIGLSSNAGIDIDVEAGGDTGPDFHLLRDVGAVVNPDTVDINRICTGS
jgi:hypothetical protein